MNTSEPSVRDQTRLRRVAEGLLAAGQAPPTRGWTVGKDTLSLLYRLASEMDRSGDALAMLHELQVHQVELDLQLEQHESNEQQLGEELQHYRDLFEQAPAGYLRVRPDGRVLEANQAARRLLPALDGPLLADGASVVDLISPEDRSALTAMLQRLAPDDAIASCEVSALEATADAPALRIRARREPGSDNLWLIVT